MYKSNSVAPSLEHEDFFWWLYEAIEYACKYRGWRDPDKKLNAQQCINKCIETIKLQKYYDLRLDKHKAVNFCYSLETPLGGEDEAGKTIGDVLESDECVDDCYIDDDAVMLIQSYINRNKIIEAILLDNIAFNDVQKHFKKTVKAQNADGELTKYTEYSSEFWPYKLIQIVSKLPATYKNYFMDRYDISEDKLTAILDVIDRANNQKLYKYLRLLLAELRTSYAVI
jgi:DNA-directed RNA polymerase subunit F